MQTSNEQNHFNRRKTSNFQRFEIEESEPENSQDFQNQSKDEQVCHFSEEN